GALYFLTGGRRLESDLYRVYYDDEATQNAVHVSETANEDGQQSQARELRKELEALHSHPESGAMDLIWQNLKHEDRFIRYAARIALEHLPVNEWQARALKESDPRILTQAMIALARQGKAQSRDAMLRSLAAIDYQALSEPEQVDLLRAFELIILRMGTPGSSMKNLVAGYLSPHYPANSNTLNQSLSKLLVYLEAPGAVEKTIALLGSAKDNAATENASAFSDLILRNPQYGLDIARMLANVPPMQQTYYATVLSGADSGWTP